MHPLQRAMAEARFKTSAPAAQGMNAAPDTRAEHVATIDTSGTCVCCTTALATSLWFCTGAVRACGLAWRAWRCICVWAPQNA